MDATIICERWVNYRTGICIEKRPTECYNIKRKEILKNIKRIIKNQSNRIIYIEFILINHNEKKVEYITDHFKIKQGKQRYIQEIKKLENGE